MSTTTSEHNAEPAASIIRLFGGAVAVAKITGRSRSQVYRWMAPPPQGTGGEIPPKARRALMDHAKLHRIRVPVGAWVGVLPPKRSTRATESA